MTTHSLNHILRRWLLSLSGVLLGLIAAMVFVLSLSDRPHSAQAADSPLPLGEELGVRENSTNWRAAVKDQPTQEGSIGPASLTPSPTLTLTGVLSDSFGWSAATAGDVNGDGYGDVIVGAFTYSPTGRANIYLGSASGLSTTPALTLTGDVGSGFGHSVATAGDVNGDGYADVVVGAVSDGNKTGRAYAYLGAPSGLSNTPAFTATGEASGDYFGYTVGTAGDVNGDGYSDVIIKAMTTSGPGKVYVYLGSATGLIATPVFTTTGGFGLGSTVGTAGDVNGDGYADIIVGTSGYRVNVYLGSASGLNVTPAFTATGSAFDEFGESVAAAGDVNGDGYADVVIGAPGSISDTGRAYIYLGSAAGLSNYLKTHESGAESENHLKTQWRASFISRRRYHSKAQANWSRPR